LEGCKLAKCNFECKNEERIRKSENSITEIRAEMNVYIRQLNENVSNIKNVIENLKAKQLSEAEIKEIVRVTVQSIDESKDKDSRMYTISIELLKMLGTTLAIIGGIQFVG
jgi:hypothetical protein